MKILVLTLLLMLTCSTSFALDGDWKLEKSQNGIKVYTRESEESDIKEFKAIATVPASLSVIDKVLGDFENYPSWQTDVESATILKSISDKQKIVHYALDLPWPADDRDLILTTTKVSLKNGGIKYKLESNHDYIDEILDYVRIKLAVGSWSFWTVENGETKIVYQFLADPGGSLPDFIINMFLVSTPFDGLTYLKSL